MTIAVKEFITDVGMNAIKALEGSGQLDSEMEDAKRSELATGQRRKQRMDSITFLHFYY